MAYISMHFCYLLISHIEVPQPLDVNTKVWALPASLAATKGITVFSFPPATEMFHFAEYRFLSLFLISG